MTAAPAIVVGGGIGGLALGIGLHRRSIPVTILERYERIDEGGAFVAMQSNAVRALAEIGLADELIRQGSIVDRFKLRSWSGRSLADIDLGAMFHRVGSPGIIVSRARLRRTLLDAFPGELRLGTPVTGIELGDDHALAVAEGHDVIRGSLLVGADGLRSTVRRGLLGPQPPRFTGVVAWRGVAPHRPEQIAPRTGEHTLGRGRLFGAWTLSEDAAGVPPGGATFWVATLAASSPDSYAEDAHALLMHHFRAAPAPIGDLLASTPPDAILRTPLYDRPASPCWGHGVVTLLGDAAHPMCPHTGQGAGLALEDAVTLAARVPDAARLDDAVAVERALRAYERARQQRTAEMAAEAAMLGRLYHVRLPGLPALRNAVFRATPARTWHSRFSSRLTFVLENSR